MLPDIVKRGVIVVIVAWAAHALTATARADNYRTAAGLTMSASETYNDSLFIRTGTNAVVRDREGDAITSIRPGFKLRYESLTSFHELTWLVGIQKFARHPELDNADNRVEWESFFEHSDKARSRILNSLTHGNVNNVTETASPGSLVPGATGAAAAGTTTYLYDMLRVSHERDLSEVSVARVEATADAFRPLQVTQEEGTGHDAVTVSASAEYELEAERNLYRLVGGPSYTYIDRRVDFLTGEARARITRELTDRIEARAELGIAVATDAEPGTDRFHDIFYGPVGAARFKYENEALRFVTEFEHSMGANVEFQTLEVEDAVIVGAEYMINEEWFAVGGLSGHLKRFTLPGAGNLPDFQRISIFNLEAGIEWSVREGYTISGRYQGRIQRATVQVLPTGMEIPFDLDYERNMVTLALEYSWPAEPRRTRLAPDEAQRRGREVEEEREQIRDLREELRRDAANR